MAASIVHTKSFTPEEPQPAQKALLDYNADFQVVICTTCQYAIQPRAITRHLKEIHGLPSRLRRPYLQYTADLHLSEPSQVLDVSNEELIKLFGDWDLSAPLDELDRYLLTHYINSTYSSLANRHSNGYLWQATISRFASANLFLRHGILALAASHILFLGDFSTFDSNQLAQAVNHHENEAESLFRASILTAPTTPLQCYAIIAFIHIYVLWSFRLFSSGQSDDFGDLFLASPDRPDLDHMAPWLYYVRHGCQLVCGFWDSVGSGPLATLARSWEIPIMADDECSTPITTLLLSVVHIGGLGSGIHEEIRTEYQQAARDLALAFSATRCLGHELTVWDAIRLWPLTVSASFIQQLKGKFPSALILLACYCIILDQVDYLWYVKGLSSSLRSNILLHLDKDWTALAQSLTVEIKSIMGEIQTKQ
ncbi:hypothetical protein FSARC_10551 [Fusarium sarcochroum]|uniref:Uncharacterized protein n=1 Tax=Fusarium sarcochroum TaxID=1208366 RepID=A0A8H4TLF1_9HYPO|nr:hypothetical protein FSARC_10551 [Fusarium sarcochroum]